MKLYLSKSTRKDKKYMITVFDKYSKKTIHFGAKDYSDYTIHKDEERKQRYLNRHRKREDWTKTGIKTAGFWSRWLLWNKPSLDKSIEDIERNFKIKILKSN